MKSIKIFALCTLMLTAAFSLSACFGQNKDNIMNTTHKANGSGFAVLELFTSEGCSSCPPADALLAEIQKETVNENVYILAFHVDYWNRQGWTDAFSKAAYSARQAQYQNWLNTSQIYTPQLVVNGKLEFIGSDERNIRNAISDQLAINANASLKLQVHHDNQQLNINYEALNAGKENNLLIALIEKNAQSNVLNGENAGRKLSHVQIVNDLQVAPLNAATGTTSIVLNKDFNPDRYEIIGFIQNSNNGNIIAATKASIVAAEMQHTSNVH